MITIQIFVSHTQHATVKKLFFFVGFFKIFSNEITFIRLEKSFESLTEKKFENNFTTNESKFNNSKNLYMLGA